MPSDPPVQEPFAAPSWEPSAFVNTVPPRQTLVFAAIACAGFMAYASYQWFVVVLLRRRATALHAVVEERADELNISMAQLADAQLRNALTGGWYVVGSMFLVGAAWAYVAAVNGGRRGVQGVNPRKVALTFAIPIVGIGYAIRELIRIVIAVGQSGRLLVIWSNLMFGYFLMWLVMFVLESTARRNARTDPALLGVLDLQVTLSIVRAVCITIITTFAVRAILHTDRVLRGGAAPTAAG